MWAAGLTGQEGVGGGDSEDLPGGVRCAVERRGLLQDEELRTAAGRAHEDKGSRQGSPRSEKKEVGMALQ